MGIYTYVHACNFLFSFSIPFSHGSHFTDLAFDLERSHKTPVSCLEQRYGWISYLLHSLQDGGTSCHGGGRCILAASLTAGSLVIGTFPSDLCTAKTEVCISYLGYVPCKSRGMKFIPLDLQGAYPRYDIHTSVFAVCSFH